jgi:hypothetical protein
MNPLDSRVSFLWKAKGKTRPDDHITFREYLKRVREGTYAKAVQRVLDTPEERQQEVKAVALPLIIPAGKFTECTNEGLETHSGIIALDDDDKTDAEASKARFAEDPHIIAAVRSPRGGVKADAFVLVKDGPDGEPRLIKNDAEHKQAVAALFDRFAWVNPDPSGKDVKRYSYFSVDPDPYVNEHAEPLVVELAPGWGSAATNGASRAGRVEVEDVIPHGKQYTVLLQAIGSLRRLGFEEPFLLSMGRHIFDNHLENPNSWWKVERAIKDIATKPVEEHTTAEAMARRAVLVLQEHGLLDGEAILANGSAVREEEEEREVSSTPWRGLPEWIFDLAPYPLRDGARCIARESERDAWFTSALGTLSACLPGVRFKDDGKEYSPHLMLFVAGRPSAGKGKAESAFGLAAPVDAHVRRASEERRAAWKEQQRAYEKTKGSGLTAEHPGAEPPQRYFQMGEFMTLQGLQVALGTHPEGVLITSSEADAISRGLNNEHGGFGYLLRKMWGHERAGKNTQTGGDEVIPQPRGAIVAVGTESQVLPLVGSTKDGLWSRFGVRWLRPAREYVPRRERRGGEALAALEKEAAEGVLEMYLALDQRGGLSVDVPAGVADYFDRNLEAVFDALLASAEEMPPEEFDATVLRGYVLASRIAVTLAVLRAHEDPDTDLRYDPVVVTEREARVAWGLAVHYIEDAFRLAYYLAGRAGNLEALTGLEGFHLDGQEAELWDALGDEFTKGDAKAWLEALPATARPSTRTLTAWLTGWEGAGAVRRQKRGEYRKAIGVRSPGELTSLTSLSSLTPQLSVNGDGASDGAPAPFFGGQIVTTPSGASAEVLQVFSDRITVLVHGAAESSFFAPGELDPVTPF